MDGAYAIETGRSTSITRPVLFGCAVCRLPVREQQRREPFHALHGTAHGVVVHELVIGEQRIEHRTGDDVLRQHFDGLCRIHGRIKVALQSLEVFIERLFVYAGLDELGYALDELVRDKSDFLCPVLPIEAVAALLHELGIHAVLQLTETKFQLPGDFRVLHSRPGFSSPS